MSKSGEPVKYPKTPLRKLSNHHYKAIEMRLEGMTYREIAEGLGFGHSTVKQWFREPVMKQAMAELTQETIDGIKAKLVKGAEQAAQTLLKISSSDEINPTVFYAARDILDRIGLKAGSKVELVGPGGGPIQVEHNINIKDRKRILEAALRAVEVLDDGEETEIYEAQVVRDYDDAEE